MLCRGVDAGNSIATSNEDLLDNWNRLPSTPIVPNTPEDDDPRQQGAVLWAAPLLRLEIDGSVVYYSLGLALRAEAGRRRVLYHVCR